MIENWCIEVDTTLLDCLRTGGPMSPAEIGRRTGMSEGEVTAFLTVLIGEGRVRLRLVGLGEQPAWREQPRPWANGSIPRVPAA
jgi:hypothetical protein